MKEGDILRLTKDNPSYKAGKCFKILSVCDEVYVVKGCWNPNKSDCEPASQTEFKKGMVVKLNERGIEDGSIKTGIQIRSNTYAKVIDIGEWNIKIQWVDTDNKLVSNWYRREYLDIYPKVISRYESTFDGIETLEFFEGSAKKSTVFKVGDKIRVHKPKDTKQSPIWINDMDKYDKQILTVKKINRYNDIEVEETICTFHPDRCTLVDTKTSGLEPHLKPEPKFKVGDTVRLINDNYADQGSRPKGYTFKIAEIIGGNITNYYRYRETIGRKDGVEETCLELVPTTLPKSYGIKTIYIDEAMAKIHKDLMDGYIHKQIVNLQGRQTEYLLSLSKTKPMTDTLKELRFEDYTKKNLKEIVAASEMLDDTLQKLCIARRRISGFESFVDKTLVALDRAYENHDKEAIAILLKQANAINKVVNSDLYKATVTGLEGLEKLDKHFEA